ncbi:MAG: DsbA family protein, partial [Sphingopyxis sp.]
PASPSATPAAPAAAPAAATMNAPVAPHMPPPAAQPAPPAPTGSARHDVAGAAQDVLANWGAWARGAVASARGRWASRPTLAAGQGAGQNGNGAWNSGAWISHPATWILGGLALLSGGYTIGSLWGGGGNRAATEQIVHDYVMAHPEIIPQAMEKMAADRAAGTINSMRARIERPYSGAWAGAADGDVVLTVFTDYFCTYCRASVPDIDRLLREDRRLKIVFRELPILSADSEPAARLALLAAKSGRYMAMHRALFATGNADRAARSAAADAQGINANVVTMNEAAISRELESNVELARALNFDGTPSWVVGNRTLTGAVGYDALRQAIAAARAER